MQIHTYCVNFITASLQNIAGEFYGSNSRCFLQGEPWTLTVGSTTFTPGDYGSGCYKVLLFICLYTYVCMYLKMWLVCIFN